MKFREFLLPSCALLLLVGSAICQDLRLLPVTGESHLTIDASGRRSDTRLSHGSSIWNNLAYSGWYSRMTSGYIWLDWGELADQGNGLPDEVIDGFTFAYATEYNPDITWAVYFFDSCSGWGDPSTVPEAGFVFTGLPSGNPWWPIWGWTVTVDLTGSGREFLLGGQIGIGQSMITPGIICGAMIGYPPDVAGNGPTGTEDAFDILYPSGAHCGTYWFGGYPAAPYASFIFELFGASDPATGTAYSDIGLQGNDAALYTLGEWADGETVRFLLRKNGMAQDGWIAANWIRYWQPWHLPGLDITLVPRIPFPVVLPMTPDPVGDFARCTHTVGTAGAHLRIYLQGAITDYFNGGPLAPVDLSNTVVSN